EVVVFIIINPLSRRFRGLDDFFLVPKLVVLIRSPIQDEHVRLRWKFVRNVSPCPVNVGLCVGSKGSCYMIDLPELSFLVTMASLKLRTQALYHRTSDGLIPSHFFLNINTQGLENCLLFERSKQLK